MSDAVPLRGMLVLGARFAIDKFEFDESVREDAEKALRDGMSMEEVQRMFGGFLCTDRFEANVFLNEGINALWLLVTGGAETAYNNANARTGVGDSTTAEAATQTGLLGVNTLLKAMDASYPLGAGSGQNVDFRSTYGSTEANFAWNEFTVDNGLTPNKNLHRKVSAQGTKTSGQTWVLTITLTGA